MNTLIAYLVSSIVSLGIFYGAYRLILSSETSFRLNRVYLLVSLVLAFLLPLLSFMPQLYDFFPVSVTGGNVLRTITLSPVEIGDSTGRYPSLFLLFGYLYLAMILVLSIRLIYQIFLMMKFRKVANKTRIGNKNIYWIQKDITPFSFFTSIFLPESIKDSADLHNIIRHEQVHIREFHSLDIVFVQVMKVIFWVNPFVFLFEKSLREVHEFVADKEVVKSGSDPMAYTMLLLQQNVSTRPLIFINNFNYSLIKRRLIMFNKKSSRYAIIRAIAFLPVALLFVSIYTIACNQPDPKQEIVVSKSLDHSNPVITSDEPDTVVFAVVEKMPQFPGGEKGRFEYIRNNIKYPDEAKKKGIQGTVFITFVVEADGSITHPKVLRGFEKSCDEEALRVIKAMPKWEPGMQKGKAVRVQFNMPIKFTLDR